MRASGTIMSQRRGGALALACGAGLALAACGSSSTPASSSGSGSNTCRTSASQPGSPRTSTRACSRSRHSRSSPPRAPRRSRWGHPPRHDIVNAVRRLDAPYLNAAFADAGYTQAQYRIDNAQGSDSTELDDATADINLGAKILVMDPIDNTIGATIAQLAASKNVTLITYDRAVFVGTTTT